MKLKSSLLVLILFLHSILLINGTTEGPILEASGKSKHRFKLKLIDGSIGASPDQLFIPIFEQVEEALTLNQTHRNDVDNLLDDLLFSESQNGKSIASLPPRQLAPNNQLNQAMFLKGQHNGLHGKNMNNGPIGQMNNGNFKAQPVSGKAQINENSPNKRPINGQNGQNNSGKKPYKYNDEVETHNLDSKHFPHQYAIQIRWGRPGQESKHARAPEMTPERHRTMNNENSRYRQFSHIEEEHVHDKQWINLADSPSDDGSSEFAVSNSKFNTLPVYVRPMRNDASMNRVRQHFAVPSPSFPVNQRFAEWANSPVNMRTHRRKAGPIRGPARQPREAAMRARNRRGHWRKHRL